MLTTLSDALQEIMENFKALSGFTERDKYIIRVLLKFRWSNFLFHSYYDLTVSGLLRDT